MEPQPGPAGPVPSPPEPLAWQWDLLAVLYAGGAFLIFLVLADFLPALVYVGCLAFLIAGLWLGRHSRRPWLDGAIYGGLSTLVAAALLVVFSSLGWLGLFAALFLALPQAVVGTWLGTRLFRR